VPTDGAGHAAAEQQQPDQPATRVMSVVWLVGDLAGEL
jgi:hypothetical protein